MDDSKKSFVLYASYSNQIKRLSLEQRGLLLTAILDYANGSQLPTLDDTTAMAFSFIQDQLDRDTEKWEDVRQKRSDAGKQGAEAKRIKRETQSNLANAFFAKQTEAKEANAFQDNQTLAKQAVNGTELDSVDNNEIINVRERTSKFKPPTLDEVKDYCWESGIKIDAQKFVDYYSSNGWKVSKNPMKDWKAAARNWERRATEFDGTKKKSKCEIIDSW